MIGISARRVPKGGWRGASIGVVGVLAASAVAATTVHRSANTGHRFRLSAAPSRRTVVAGLTARYRISIGRRGFRGPIKLTVARTPQGILPRLTSRGSLRMLTVVTSGRARIGRYRLLVRARGGRLTAAIRLILQLRRGWPVTIGISGAVGDLQPGMPRPLDLTLRNASSEWLWVTSLAVSARSVAASRSTALLPCTPADFSIQQFSGIYPLVLAPRTALALSSLGVPAAQWPQVMLVNRPRDQDGCQRATVTLGYAARGTTV